MPDNPPQELITITNSLKAQLLQKDFSENFISLHGQPQWQDAIKLKQQSTTDITLLIPTKKNLDILTFIEATIKPDSSVSFLLHRKSWANNNIKEYSYATLTPFKIKTLFNIFENKNSGKNLSSNSLNDPISICWSEFQQIPCSGSGGGYWTKPTSIQTNDVIIIPRICYGWVQHCQTVDGGPMPPSVNPPAPGDGGGGFGGIDNTPPCPPGEINAWYLPSAATTCGEPRDENGFLLSRINELNQILAINPFALEPCDSLNIMPLDPVNGYGAMWQRVAQFTPTQYVKNRIDSIRSVATNWIVDNFYLTNVSGAFGGTLNCDFFPVKITQLPIGFTAESLVEYFRKNINQFIDPNLNISFHPYVDGSFNDSAKFNSVDTSSLGALVHLHMLQDGSIIESGYYHSNTANNEKHRFTYTTMATPLDFSHPVAGNREFGIYSKPNTNGEFTFYTMGVDRINDWVFSAGDVIMQQTTGKNGFDKADELWTSVKKNMIAFITNHQGHAEPYQSIKARPRWVDVKDYLLGNIDYATLKQRLGC